MAELTDDLKLEIVTMLACFRDLVTIQEHFRQEHQLDLTARQVGAYDPTRTYFEAGDKWRDIFDQKRKQYLEGVAAVPIANQGFRLNLLYEMVTKAIKDDKPALAAALLEQAAKEVGGVLTNQRDVRIDDSRRQRAADMSPEDRRLALAEVIRQVIEQRGAPGDPAGMSPGSPTPQ